MSKNLSSKVLSWSSFFLTILSFLYLYSIGSILWLIVGLIIPIVFTTLIIGIDRFIKKFPLPKYKESVYRIILIILSLSFSISSIYGLYLTFLIFPINDISYLFIPFVVISFFLAGSSFEMFQVNSNIRS